MCVNKSLTIFARGHLRSNRLLTAEAFDIATTMRCGRERRLASRPADQASHVAQSALAGGAGASELMRLAGWPAGPYCAALGARQLAP
jgi:hypothetical protein